MKLVFLLLSITVFVVAQNRPKIIDVTQYEPNWDSLDTRPIPEWFDKAKIGIFITWGVFSVPSYKSEWFWMNWKSDQPDGPYNKFMQKNYPPNWTYQDFAKDLTAEFYNATQWAEIFQKSGAKYVVLTSKHHDGYTLWPSKYTYSWNAQDVGPNRDVLGDLANAVRAQNLTFGLYHSLFEWFNPIYLSDKNTNFTQQEFVNNKVLPEMFELINKYKPAVLWSDGDWEASDTYWKSTDFLAWLYNESPVRDFVVTNGRWGIGIPCRHGDFFSCQDRFNPGTLQHHKWENAMTLDKLSWGYRREAPLTEYFTIEELLETVAQTISCGGNILINVGPTKEGTIHPIFEELLLQLGEWLSINGEAIYESSPWEFQNDTLTPGVWYTAKEDTVYAIVLKWPQNNTLNLETVTGAKTVLFLENGKNLSFDITDEVASIQFPDLATVKSQWAWVLKIII